MKDVYYLSGIDWVMYALDLSARRRTGIGTYSQVILDLAGVSPARDMEEAAAQFIRRLPVLHGRICRALNLAPYWNIPSRVLSVDSISSSSVSSREKALAVLEKAVNTPFARKDQHLRFYSVIHPQGSYFSLVFDHLILDARGAETLLSMFNEFSAGGKIIFDAPVQGHQLSAWKRKFSAGRRVNRFFRALGQPAEAGGRAGRERMPGGAECVFRHHTFDVQQSRRIAELADEKAGYLMLMPYTLAAVISALHDSRLGKCSRGGEYLIPVNLDTRSADKCRKDVFFNHVSFLFFRVRKEDSGDMENILATVKDQMYGQVKNGFPRDLEEASLLMRIVPARLLHYVLGTVMRENEAAFAFSFNAAGGFASAEFIRVPVRGVFHTPRVPVPPGMGVFFTRYGERLSVVFSYLRGMISEAGADAVMERIRARLLGGSDAG
ncbi:MAG: hypothetical protein PHC33_03660 [Candidatus Omnitrophica bacterium]|nr:hypothetical protein [Candidatus Omnitrophota bacterium]